MTTTRRIRLRARLGAALIASSLGLALIAVPGGGLAQEEPEAEPVEVTQDAVYAQSAGKALPDTLTSEFPPGVVCIVASDLCTEQTQDLTQPIEDLLTGADLDGDGEDDTPPVEDTPDDQSPQQVRAPGTVTVAQLSGEQRYAGGIEFALPEVPAGHEVVTATLILHETAPTYHTSSPFFRQMVLAALAGVNDPAAALAEAQKAIMNENDQYPVEEREVGNVGVEVCPFTEAFEAGAHEWGATPAFDCIFGANGTRIETADGWEWHFDLGFTVAAWQDGTLENHGLYLRATRAPNLAFGDPDTSWQAQISFGSAGSGAPPELALTTIEAASSTPPAFVPPPSNAGDAGSGGSTSNQGSSFPPPQAFPSTSAPTPAAPAPVAEPGPAVAPQQQPQPVATGQLAASPSTPWWIWLLVPTFLLGMFMVSQSLTAEAQQALVREGAMTRLIRQRHVGDLATGSPQFQV